MKTQSSTIKTHRISLHEKNLRIHNNLWKFYSLFFFIGILILLIKGLN